MRKFLLTLLALTALALPAAPAMAQDDSDEDGAGFITRMIQNALSDAGREVRITGFRGALSSTATLEKLTIADSEGVWLELDNAVLNWSRAALFRRQLRVNELSAENITLYRLPPSSDMDSGAPAPESSGFSIPDLPLRVIVKELSIDSFDMKEPVIGQAAVLSLDGNLTLADGGLDTKLELERQDKPGQIAIKAAFTPEDERLSVDVSVNEPEGGLLANLMDLPGRPSVDARIQGDGPLDDFSAEMLLSTDGEERLSGNVTLVGRNDGGREFSVKLGGDLTALAGQDYREFLGTEIGLIATGAMAGDGAVDLELLRVTSAALNLEGNLSLDSDRQPTAFKLTGGITHPEGEERVDLPFGQGISLASAKLDLSFDRSQSDQVSGRIEALAPAAEGFSARILALDIGGALPANGAGQVDIDFEASGLSADDPAVAKALGDSATGSASVAFGDGPLEIRDLVFENQAIALNGSASFDTADKQALVNVTAKTQVSDLSAFDQLAGMDLAGAADLDVVLDLKVPAGDVHLVAKGSGTGLKVGIEQADAVLATPVALDVDIERGQTGITINTLDLGNEAVQLTAKGRMASNDGEITYALSMPDVGVVTGTGGGGVDFSGAISQTPEEMRITGAGGGQDLKTGIDVVDDLLAGALDLDFDLSLPTEGAPVLHASRIETGELRVQASGDLDPKAMTVDVTARLDNSGVFTGTEAGPVNLNGTVRTDDAGVIHAVLKGGGDRIGTGIEPLDNLLQGRVVVDADVTVDGPKITVNKAMVSSPGISADIDGTVTDGDTVDLRFTLALPNVAAPLGEQAGPLDVSARLTGSGGRYRVEADGKGQSVGIGNDMIDALFEGDSTLRLAVQREVNGDIKVEEASFSSVAIKANTTGVIDSRGPTLDFNAQLDNMARLVPELRGPLTVRGNTRPASGGGYNVSLNADGPGGAQARVSGKAGLANGAVDLAINGNVPVGLANGFLAPRSVTGSARFNLTMRGQPGLEALNGQVTLGDVRLVAPTLGQVIDGIGGTVSVAGGQATMNVTVAPGTGGQIRITGPIGLAPPFNAGIKVALNNFIFTQGNAATTRLNGNIAINGGLTGGGTISGRVGLSGTELRLASTGLGGPEAIPDITHVAEPSGSFITRKRAGLVQEPGASGGGGGGSSVGLGLDLLLETDTAVFIRGRGIDAEMRGSLRIGGTTANPQPVGQFNLSRGRLDLVLKRLNFTEGWVQIAGDFSPVLHFVATAENNGYDFTITIDGTPTDPTVVFKSDPDLPEDEVVSQLFFGQGIDQISALQAAQLATAVAVLTGSGDGGIMNRIREKTGLDELDLSTTEDGQTSLTAGKYLSENVYTETEVTGDGETSLSINLDLTNNITTQAEATSDGETRFGIFFQKDY